MANKKMKKASSRKKKVETKEVKSTRKKFLGAVNGFGSFGANSFNQDLIIDPSQLLDLYRQNPDVRQAVAKISNYVGKRGASLVNKKTGEIFDEGEAKKLKNYYLGLLRTQKERTFNQFKKRLFRDLLVVGQLYITYTIDLEGNKMNGIQFLDSRTVTKHIGRGGVVSGYTQNGTDRTKNRAYTAFAEQATKTKPFLASYMFEVHTKNEDVGMGQLEAVVWDALSDLGASKRNYYVMHNDIKTPSMFLLDPDISDDEHDILIEQLRDNYGGLHNQGKPIVGQGIKEVKSLMLSPRDMEYVNQKKLTTDKVASTFGVPKYILGYTENVNLNNGQGNKQEFIEGTVMPNQDLFSFIINDFFEDIADVPGLGFEDPEYNLIFHTDAVDTDIERDKVSLEKLKNGVITLNEYRLDDGREVYNDVENSNKPMINRNQILVEDISFDLGITADEKTES